MLHKYRRKAYHGVGVLTRRHLSSIVPVLVVAIYVALRLWRLDASCLWFDEIFSVHAAEHGFADFFRFVALDLVHPPLFYLILKAWINIGGEGVYWLRLLPALFSFLAIIPLGLFVREVAPDRKWVLSLALFLMAVSGPMIKYSQEVRMYSLLLLLSLTSLWLFLRLCRAGKGLAILTIVNILLIYTQYFGWYAILVELVAAALFFRERLSRIALMTGIAAVSFLPWALTVWRASVESVGLVQNIGGTVRPGFAAVAQLSLNLVEPFYTPGTTADPISIYRIAVPLLVLCAVAVALYFGKAANDRTLTPIGNALLTFASVPIVIAYIVSWLSPYSVWGTRHLIVIFGPVYVLVALAVLGANSQWLRQGVIALTILFPGYAFALDLRRDPNFIWCTWEQLADTTHAAANVQDTHVPIYVFEDLVAYHFWFRLRESTVRVVRDVEGVQEDQGFFLPRGFDNVPVVQMADIHDSKLWIAYRVSETNRRTPLDTFMAAGYVPLEKREIDAGGQTAYLVLLEKR